MTYLQFVNITILSGEFCFSLELESAFYWSNYFTICYTITLKFECYVDANYVVVEIEGVVSVVVVGVVVGVGVVTFGMIHVPFVGKVQRLVKISKINPALQNCKFDSPLLQMK